MPHDVVAVSVMSGHRIRLRFDDGVEGELDLADAIRFDGIFAPLKDPVFFARVAVHPELGVIHWPNGADLDSDVLHSRVTGQPILAATG